MPEKPLSLHELLNMVRQTLEMTMPESYWVQAELSEVRENVSGHCYLELVETSSNGRGLTAKVRAVVWRNTYALLKPHFERETGRRLQAGMKVLVRVAVSFHEIYGLSFVVSDIDPGYTLGDLALRRKQILMRLEQEGVLDMNKELTLPRSVQRIAVISSGTAAGYGDFCHQLQSNSRGFVFYTRLFPALMQGDHVTDSIINALNVISESALDWDAVVIIRGGGAVSDLNGFESYDLACNCAQYPIPIITGIGHERDDTVIDFVAHTRCKTPTAVADFLITRAEDAWQQTECAAKRLQQLVKSRVSAEQERVRNALFRLPQTVHRLCENEHRRYHDLGSRVQFAVQRIFATQDQRQQNAAYRMRFLSSALLTRHRNELQRQERQLRADARYNIARADKRMSRVEQTIRLSDPSHLLKLGYSITRCKGRAVTQSSQLRLGDVLVTQFASGQVESRVTGHGNTEQTQP